MTGVASHAAQPACALRLRGPHLGIKQPALRLGPPLRTGCLCVLEQCLDVSADPRLRPRRATVAVACQHISASLNQGTAGGQVIFARRHVQSGGLVVVPAVDGTACRMVE